MAGTAEDRLDPWKEIAAYLKRGVRTVRRWEKDEGLPVHRHVHRVLGSVYAYRSEIDRWRDGSRGGAARPSTRRRGGAAAVKSIAVLPFENLGADPDNEYFADGLTDDVTSGLSRISALRVTSRTSAMTFKGTNQAVGSISRALGARYILEGSVRRAGERMRITARLIDAAADNLLWTETWNGPIEDVFAMQERLSRAIVTALEVRLTGEEDRGLTARPIGNLHAYECYVRARQEAWRWRRDAIDHAIQLLRNGIALVGDDARLYAALGHAYERVPQAGEVLEAFPLEVRETIPAQIAGFLVRAARDKSGPAAAPPHIDLGATAGDVFPRMLAQAYALAAMPDEAIACLKVAVDRGFINYPFLANHDPFFERIRRLAAFQELLAVVHDRWQAFEPA